MSSAWALLRFYSCYATIKQLFFLSNSLINWNDWQVLATTAAVGVIAHRFAGLPGPAAIVIGCGLALSSTAVVLQVLT